MPGSKNIVRSKSSSLRGCRPQG